MTTIKDEQQAKMSKALGAAFLKSRVEELEKSVNNLQLKESNERNSNKHTLNLNRKKVLVDGTALVFALPVLKRWVYEGTHDLIIPLHAINTLDLTKQSQTHSETMAQLATQSRSASAWLENQLEKHSSRISLQTLQKSKDDQQQLHISNSRWLSSLLVSLNEVDHDTPLVVASPPHEHNSESQWDRFDVDRIINEVEKANHQFEIILKAEIEDAELWSMERKLKYQKRKKRQT